MEAYSVKEIAEMLNTNPETVRRWIRDKKLNAVISSNKNGNVVYRSELVKFLDSAPKYARIAGASATVTPVLGISAAVLTIAGGIIAGQVDSNRIKNARIPPNDLAKYIKNEISLRKTNIKKRAKEIEVLQEDIKAEEQQIEQLIFLLNNVDEGII